MRATSYPLPACTLQCVFTCYYLESRKQPFAQGAESSLGITRSYASMAGESLDAVDELARVSLQELDGVGWGSYRRLWLRPTALILTIRVFMNIRNVFM